MNKKILFIFNLTVILLLVIGCQSKGNNSVNTSITNPSQSDSHEGLLINNSVKSIGIVKSDSTNEIIYKDNNSLQTFKSILSTATKEDGIFDLADSQYTMNIYYDNKNQDKLYLWIGEEGQISRFMNSEDTQSTYSVSKESTDKLIELIKSR
ncbi:hypothetical protein [Paenibacillus sp. PAMC 26794]|uniref:hypothetical protein n=1 Tax=Paenibacillus sp. PAMC 26794 TaxID=1257080 RepID=UPI00037155C1|nr:hypothetical protein [Paenibacillus sp. PAMC 26794]